MTFFYDILVQVIKLKTATSTSLTKAVILAVEIKSKQQLEGFINTS